MNRAKGLEFHIEHDDYFGTLATIIDLIKQEVDKNFFSKPHTEVLDNVVKDLVHLQKNYKIIKK